MSDQGHGTDDPAGSDAHALIEEVADSVDAALDPEAPRRWKRGDTARVVIATTALVACWLAASHGVSGFEDATFRAVNSLPDWLYPVVWPVMQMGNVAVGVVVAIIVVAIVRKPRLGLFFVVTPIAAWFLAKAVKAQVQRGRPEPEGLVVTLRGPAEDGFGFISGHATVAFAVAAVAMPHLRRPWNYVALALAVVVGAARLYVGAHLPLDVVGGAACGLLLGEAVRVVEVATRRRSRPVTSR